jgi:hypothetical protein
LINYQIFSINATTRFYATDDHSSRIRWDSTIDNSIIYSTKMTIHIGIN